MAVVVYQGAIQTKVSDMLVFLWLFFIAFFFFAARDIQYLINHFAFFPWSYMLLPNTDIHAVTFISIE